MIARHDRSAAEHAALVGGSSSLADLEQELAAASADLRLARELSEQALQGRGDTWPAASKPNWRISRWSKPDSKSGSPRQTGDGQWTERGLDQVEFFLSANLGEEPRPLARIVSGGELSRVMLALKTLSRRQRRPGRHPDPHLRRG